jgi:D-sedoheptulose 7-phosphate isomerase
MATQYTTAFLAETVEIVTGLDAEALDAMAEVIASTKRRGGRLFIAGSGGGAGHASHAVCDFRKLAGIESYSVTDNVSELTARINDNSWADSYADWLTASRVRREDTLFVFSVGGGDADRKISENLVRAMDRAKEAGASVVGIVGRDGGYVAKVADAAVVVPTGNPANVTTQTEGFQALLWHLIVLHPALESATPMWESQTV